jgi:NAD(P)-dependent dehydrogenase (short-subunit alcohol dehydrogenase family)
MKRLEGKLAVITGGTTGIGLATAKLFAREGARVVVTGKDPTTLAAAREELAHLAEVVASDAGSAEDVRALAASIAEAHGAVDVLFLNAGVTRYGLIASMPEAALDDCMRVNFKGAWLAIKHFAALLPRGGSIVLNTSMTNQLGQPYTSAYAASKAALAQLARSAAAELAPAGVRVNAVSPGPTDTPIHSKQGLDQILRGLAPQIPLARLGRPIDIAHAVLFLASEESSFMTGQELLVDGGMTHLRTHG